MRRALVPAVVAVAALGGGGAAAQAAEPQPSPSLFEWSTPVGFGEARDTAGLLKEANPDQLHDGPRTIVLQNSDSLCANGRPRWSPRRLVRTIGPCAFEARVPHEGRAYPLRVSAGGRTDEQKIMAKDLLVVSLGDSVASGEGLPDIPGTLRARWQDPRCHRSARAGPALAAAQMDRDDTRSSVSFVHLACSGAEVRHGLLGGYAGIVPPKSKDAPRITPQVKVLNRLVRRGLTPDAVLVSIGANDVGFGPIVAFCAEHPRCFSKPYPHRGSPSVSDFVRRRLERLRHDYVRLNRAIDPRVPRKRIFIVDYFDPTHDAHGSTCPSILVGVTRAELEQAQREILAPLNGAVADAAAHNGWSLIGGNAARFREHGYCAHGRRWVTLLSASVRDLGGPVGGRLKGTLHPNEVGQQMIGRAISRKLEVAFFGKTFADTAPAEAPDDDSLSVLGVLAIALAALALVIAPSLISKKVAFIERTVVGFLVAGVGLVAVAVALLLRDTPVTAGLLAAAGGGALAMVGLRVLR